MPLPTQITDNQTALRDLWTSLRTMQDARKGDRNHWQIKRSHEVPPKDGSTDIPENREDRTHGDKSWGDAGLPASFPFQVECSNFKSKFGYGYKMIARIVIGKDTWKKTFFKGPKMDESSSYGKWEIEEDVI